MLQTYGIADFVYQQKYQMGAGYCLSNPWPTSRQN